MLSDDNLIKSCKKGNRKAQMSLYNKYAPTLLGICIRYCNSREDAEDILQESFVKIFNNISNLQKEESLLFWMRRIVINTTLRYLSSNKNSLRTESIDVDGYLDRSDINKYIEESSCNELLKLIQELPSGYRTIFNLYAIEGYKHREIAEMLNISEGTSKSQYFSAKKLLQSKIQKQAILEKELLELSYQIVEDGV